MTAASKGSNMNIDNSQASFFGDRQNVRQGNSRRVGSFKSLALIGAIIAATALSACSSKKKATDNEVPQEAAAPAAPAAPQIDSTPMSFDAAGSDSGKISGLQTINFEYDKSSLSSDAKQKLQGNAEWIKGHANTNVQIEGHCDSRGSIEYNLSLGERRAQAVKSYMVSLGVAANRLNVISYGKEKPVSSGDSESDMAKNRRANFVPIAN